MVRYETKEAKYGFTGNATAFVIFLQTNSGKRYDKRLNHVKINSAPVK